MKWIALVSWFFLCVCLVKSEEFTYGYGDAMRCKEHICRLGYKYDTFYRVDDNEVRSIDSNPDTAFEMHIAIQAASNGHIVLSEIPNPGVDDAVYEIVVGGGGNKFTELRRNLRRNAKSSVNTPHVLSSVELRGFYIKISEDGLVEFGREGVTLPLISFSDVDPLSIKYFAFAAWNGVEAKFLYDCPVPGEKDADGRLPDSPQVQPDLTPSDKLKRTLLVGRLPFIPPKPSMEVNLGLKLTSLHYNAVESKMTTTAAVIVSWTDETLAWNPDKFNGTTSIRLRQGQIWRPSFFVLNSDTGDNFGAHRSEPIVINSSGEATLHFQALITNYCFDAASNYSRWPHDIYECLIIIESWEAHEDVSINALLSTDTKFDSFLDIDKMIHNDWNINRQNYTIPSLIWNMVMDPELAKISHVADKFILYVDFSRSPTFYNMVFYLPLIVLNIFILTSFWSEPLTMSRVWFYLSCVIFICFGLCYIDYLIPTHNIPTLLILYVIVLFGLITIIYANVILISSFGEELAKSMCTKLILTNGIIRTVFCLAPMKIPSNGGYMTQQDEDDASYIIETRDNVEEMESENITKYGDKNELAIVVDKILLTVYLLVFIPMLAMNY